MHPKKIEYFFLLPYYKFYMYNILNNRCSKYITYQGISNLNNFLLRNFLKTNIFNNSGKHQFEITEDQVKILNKSSIKFSEIDPKLWLKIVWHNDGTFLFPSSTSQKVRNNIIKDQMTRADAIVNYMIQNNIFKIRTMDGHGRFVMCLLNSLENHQVNINDYQIELIDINRNVTDWHKIFMPSNVKVITDQNGNGYNILESELDFSETCLYLNFCGIGSFLDDLNNYLLNKTNDIYKIFLSFSSRGKRPGPKFDRSVKDYQLNGQFISRRSNFYTLCL